MFSLRWSDVKTRLELDRYSFFGIYSYKGISIVWAVEYTDEFGEWWKKLSEGQQDDATAVVELLEVYTHR